MIHCPTCDAGLRFEVESQKMACDHCGNRLDVEQVPDLERFDAKGHKMLDLYVFVCPDCGAELAVNDKNDAVGFCPYCGGASMLFDRVKQSWVPDGIIPFKITKEQCKQAYLDEVRKHPFVSKRFRDPTLVDSFRGIYMPYWSFEGRQQEPFKVERRETLPGSGKNEEIERTYEQWFDIDYTVTGFSHDASTSFDDHTSERLAPYNDEELEGFHSGYLSGFYAEIADMEPDVYERYAVEKCQEFTGGQVSGGMKRAEMRGIKTEVKSLSNVLYPVWFMSYRRGPKHDGDEARISYAAVNGQTGKVSADLPVSPLRVVAAALALTVAFFALIAMFFGALPSIKAPDILVLCIAISTVSACFLSDSCLGTLEQALKLEGRPKSLGFLEDIATIPRKPWTAAIMAFLAVLGIVLFVTDGSYRGGGRSVGGFLFFVGCVYYLSWALGQILNTFNYKPYLMMGVTSRIENAVIESYLKYEKLFFTVNAIIGGVCIVAVVIVMMGFTDKFVCYAFCFAMAIAILAQAAVQIAFQTTISERKPPQMAKEGAFYDEH